MKRAAVLIHATFGATAALAQNAGTPGEPPPGGEMHGGMHGSGAHGPGMHGAGGMHGPSVDQLAADLNLTDAQKAQVQKIFDAQRAKHEAARAQFEAAGTRPSPDEMHARMEAGRADVHEQLAAVLTPEQMQKFDAMAQQHRSHGPGAGAEGTAPPR